jgi:dienelactone hydrolase
MLRQTCGVLLTWLVLLAFDCDLRAEDLASATGPPLSDTEPLTLEGDISELMIAGVDRFLLKELDASIARRARLWKRDVSSAAAYTKSIEHNRQRLTRIIGLRDPRVKFDDLELVATVSQSAQVGKAERYTVTSVRWPVFDGVHGEGLLLEPSRTAQRAVVIVIPDCEQLPEAQAGLIAGLPPESQIARRLAESGCRVIVPLLINRGTQFSSIADGRRKSTANHRELLYRAAYQMGRHLIGYEVQKVLALVNWHSRATGPGQSPIGVVGYGEGGAIALYAAAVDPRIAAVGMSGYFNSRQQIWKEPIDRNVFGLLAGFGDAELATLVLPRPVIIEACAVPAVVIAAGGDGAPADSPSPPLDVVRAEVARARELVTGLEGAAIDLVKSGGGTGPAGSDSFLATFLRRLASAELSAPQAAPQHLRTEFDPLPRLHRQFRELADLSERLVNEGPRIRAEYFSKVDRRNGLEKYSESIAPYRAEFRDRIIGAFDGPLLRPAPRSRLAYDDAAFRGYQVVLDVLPDVVLYCILLVPKDVAPGERRPVVVCQHGLEGRAESTVQGDNTSYRDFAARLARRGFITVAPQHLYRGGDRFRTLQRKANPLGKSLFSVMTAQHRQLVDWLATLPWVDPRRIAFYGISYGGKSAMRIPAQLDGYCLSICSSDFSDWIWRTASQRFESGYLAHAEYEIFEFDLGATFNYGEMAALICPRPFMVEEFHHSGLVADRNRGEFARVQLLYENLGIGPRTRWTYYGAYQANVPYAERETFDFLHEHLQWRRP